MFFVTAKTGFGKRLGRAFFSGIIPILAICLAIGYCNSISMAQDTLRMPISNATRETFYRQLSKHMSDSKQYYLATAGLLLLVVAMAWRCRKRQERLGDEIEGLVRRAMHDQARSLSAINIAAKGLLDGNADAKSIAAEIEAISRCETKKIDSYMLLAKDFAGYGSASAEGVNFSAAVCRIAADMKMREKNVEINCSVPKEDVFVRAHPALVAELVGNLVENAVKYADGGTVSLSLAACGRHVVLTVSDTGRGIPKHAQRHVFERFYRAENATGVPGTGLGLSTVHELVTRHYHGKVKLKSKLGKGTTITVTLPRLGRTA